MAKDMKKLSLTGLGLVLLTKDEIDKYMKKMMKQYNMDAKKGKKMAKELISKSEKQRKKFEKEIQGQVKQYMDKMNIARKSDLDKLKREVDKLSKKR